eukprot:127232-Chlamydomonas_euryale.AAC.1
MMVPAAMRHHTLVRHANGARSTLADLGFEASWYHHAQCRSGWRAFVVRVNPAAGWRMPRR